ncbi:unnamed protein product [Ectocarpus sp. 6 AP-2014]
MNTAATNEVLRKAGRRLGRGEPGRERGRGRVRLAASGLVRWPPARQRAATGRGMGDGGLLLSWICRGDPVLTVGVSRVNLFAL